MITNCCSGPAGAKSGDSQADDVDLQDAPGSLCANDEIGAILGTSPRTVQKHLERIYQKLGVETRTAAAARARQAAN
ncbi:MAG: hypothetical protein HY725_19735 [Candidatus Rokubacteria bacterium]|nr:hypothetical protein [Candidatus Rokubacteria bacterium]